MNKIKPYFDNYWSWEGDFEFMTPAIGFTFVSKTNDNPVSWVLFFSVGFWVFGIMYRSN